MSKRTAELIATVFYSGYFPIASGTLGSLIGAAIYYFVKDNTVAYFFVVAALLMLGLFSSDAYEKYIKRKDPHEVIIDETAGIFLAYLFIPFSLKLLIAGFIIYRIFDVIKPPPLRALEKLPGGLGIMADDIAAGIYTNIILRILIFYRLFP